MKWKSEKRRPDIIGLFNLHSRDFSTQLPFAEVLGSELLLTRFLFSSFQGRVLARFFLARLFELGFQKRCKGVHYVDIGESFPTSYSNEYLLAKFGFDTGENESPKVYLISDNFC